MTTDGKIINNDIKEPPCSIELCALLKEKGFNYKPEYYYYPNDERDVSLMKYILRHKYFKFKEYFDTIEFDYLSGKFHLVIPAPTHALAIKWLWNNFGIWIYAELILGLEDQRFNAVIDNKYHTSYNRLSADYDSPEKAMEAALLYVLKNII